MSESVSGKGIVYLVGAGPGDPGLITIRGQELLKRAQVIVYDYLSNPRLLDVNPAAQTIYVGKKAAAHSFSQDQINATLIEHGRAGKVVVRLKGGDPYVFGRGGEEAEALREAGIPFEEVPGVTAAIAAPAYAGIPVTHRDFNSSFTFITGHEKEEEYRDEEARSRQAGGASDLDWSAIARLPCIAFYMGVKALPRICAKLIEHGMSAQTPAATIRWGTLARQQTVVGTLADLPQKVAEAKLGPPAITIVGKVVSLRETLNWFENRPLSGQTIAVTRTRQQASDLTARLVELGAHVIEAPTIELVAPDEWSGVDEALHHIDQYDWVIFTSQNGVRFVRDRLFAGLLDARAFAGVKIAAIGDATADAIRNHLCLNVDLCPKRFVAEALAEALEEKREVADRKFLMLRADIARPMLRERLLKGGAAEVKDVAVYETQPAQSLPVELLESLDAKQINWMTFTSSSTARNMAALLGDNYKARLQGVKIASIGPITTQTIEELGLTPTITAETYSIDGLVKAILEASGPQGRTC